MISESITLAQAAPRRVFLSYSAKDKVDIGKLRDALISHGVNAWEDVLELRLGDSLAELKQAIEAADAFVLLLTPASIGSEWVQREVGWALGAKATRPRYALLPLLRGLDRPALNLVGAAELVSIVLGLSHPIESAVPTILQALGLSPVLPVPHEQAPPLVPALADLTIELTRPRMVLHNGGRRPMADMRVVFHPAVANSREIDGDPGEFEAPLGALEADDMRWYLEEFPLWAYGVRRERAAKIEKALPQWGRRLFDAALGPAGQAAPFRAWRDAGRAERRITVKVDDRGPAPEVERHEAAARLLALPWELLHDGTGYLFEGAHGARVRRRLPSTHAMHEAPPSSLPLRVMVVLSRPEGDGVGFLDPRSSLMPLSTVLATLGCAVDLTVLPDGSFQTLADALREAYDAKRTYHVVHFDGHGVYDPVKGLGALVFEDEEDVRKGTLKRKAKRVFADDIGAALRDYRVPLFVLEACQSAQADEQPHASVATTLLRAGVASVVAMSHSVLVSTARRFVEAFYGGLLKGQRIGTAMASAQRKLKHNRTRGERNDGSRVELDDWLVPVLFQEGNADPPLIPCGADMGPHTRHARQLKEQLAQGKLPPPPTHTFVGRGRELLAIDRKLLAATEGNRLLALVGPGGLGKTALAIETARWMLAIRRVQRVAFASVEEVSDARGVIATLGEQLVPGYTIARAESEGRESEKLHNALLPIEQALWSAPTLIVIDNLESVLPMPGDKPSEDVNALFGALVRLAKAGETRIVFTSRESVPEAVTAGLRVPTLELRIGALGRVEAMELLGAVLRQNGHSPAGEAATEQVEALVDAVGGHARSLVLLAGEVVTRGVAKTTEEVRELMRSLEKRHPGKTDELKRELSVIASARLSLRRLPEAVQRQIRPLGVLHGPAHFLTVAKVLEIESEVALELCRQLIHVGLADADGPYLLLDPALTVALAEDLSAKERAAAEARWLGAVEAFVGFLYEHKWKNPHLALQGTRTTLVDLLATLEKRVAEVETGARDAVGVIGFVTSLEQLVSSLGLPRVLRRVLAARQSLAARLPPWSAARFRAESQEIDRKLEAGDLPGALMLALVVRDRNEVPGDAHPEAKYDRAAAWFRLGRVLQMGGNADHALNTLRKAEKHFKALAMSGSEGAALMEAGSVIEQADALRDLGRLDEAVEAYEKGIQMAESLGDMRSAAVGRGQLATVRVYQGRLSDALSAYTHARGTFERLGEPRAVAAIWHQLGRVHAEVEQFDAAETAYRSSLALSVREGNKPGEAMTLCDLGNVYRLRGRIDDSARYYQQAAELFNALDDKAHECIAQNNLGIALHCLSRFDEARQALSAALALIQNLGYSAEPWKTWTVLADLECDAGNPEAAAQARRQAMAIYHAYRIDGGEPMDSAARLIWEFGQALRTQGPDVARSIVAQIDSPPDWLRPILHALEDLAAGNRDPSLAADPALEPTNAVELALALAALSAPI